MCAFVLGGVIVASVGIDETLASRTKYVKACPFSKGPILL